MSFLLGRSSNTSTPHGNHGNNTLFDAGSNDGEHDDDELEAAFGDSDARELDPARDYRGQAGRSETQEQRGTSQGNGGIQLHAYRPQGHGHVGEDSITIDDIDSEDVHLLHGSSNLSASNGHHPEAGGSSRSHSPRPRLPTAHTSSSNTTNSNPGGYDFEADPYERRSAPISLGADDDDEDDDALPTSRRRRQGLSAGRHNVTPAAGSGLLGAFRRLLPSRFQQYGILNQDSRAAGGRRTDGTIDHGEDEDEDEDAWIAPPPSMPGIYGGGLSNDGVFANMAAKPGIRGRGDRPDVVGGDDEAPEKEIPPAYELAVLDAAPPYFDTTVHAPGLGGIGGVAGVTGGLEEILIEGLPLGNPFSFFWSLLVSMSFQFVGFLLTTLLSTSHAAKNGSRAGLGITLIQYGLYLGATGEDIFNEPVSGDSTSGDGGKDEWAAFWGVAGGDAAAPTPTGAAAKLILRTLVDGAASMSNNGTQDPWKGPVLLDGAAAVNGIATSWMSMVLMIGGWFLLVSSLTQYLKAIKYAKALRDGVTTNPDSWLERGGPIGTLYTRVTGREMPSLQQERTWGLAPRPAPRQPTQNTSSAPDPPPVSTRPSGFLPSFINRGATGVRNI